MMIAHAIEGLAAEGLAAEAAWWTLVALLIVLFTVNLASMVFDARTLDGENVWAKPAKFNLSLALHFATLAFVLERLDLETRQSGAMSVIAYASIAATLFEIIYIGARAARAERSHFNLGTSFGASMYVLMALGAVMITVAAGAVGVAALASEGALAPALRVGFGAGLLAGALLTFVTAFRIGAALNHHVSPEPAGARPMPITGWSLKVADRRVPHFLGTHTMQVVPASALLADALLPADAALYVVGGVTCVWVLVTLYVFDRTNSGLPLKELVPQRRKA